MLNTGTATEMLKRGFTRRDLARAMALMTAGSALPFFNEPAMAQLAREGYDPAFGARPLKRIIQRESLAEDMRLLYVAVTRAIYQCHIGISHSTSGRKNVFPNTVWSHLLDLDGVDNPGWDRLRTALQARLCGVEDHVAYSEAGRSEDALLAFERATGGSEDVRAARQAGEEYLLARGLFRRKSSGD